MSVPRKFYWPGDAAAHDAAAAAHYAERDALALQTKLESLTEAFINIIVGYWISFLANALILPLVGLDVTWRQNLLIGFFMTFVSVARQYAIRRWAQKYLRQFKLAVVTKIKGLL